MAVLLGFICSQAAAAADGLPASGLFSRTNLVAWCVVPFDAKKRGPEERAEMLKELGLRRLAYDYRAEHVPTFEREIETLARHQIELTAWWFPPTLNAEAKHILGLLARHRLRPQLWVTGGGEPVRSAQEQIERVEREAGRIREIAAAAAALGCPVGLYNHGGWFGEPDNQLAIIEHLRRSGLTNVGLVYNLHHGHDHVDQFPDLLRRMKPHLLALNLNGTNRDGDKRGEKILVLGAGGEDRRILRTIRESGWSGPLGLLNHTDEDAEQRLRENLRGLERLVAEMQ